MHRPTSQPPAAPVRGDSPSERIAAAFHLSAIVQSSDDAIISKDLNGIIISWNAGAERIFGYRDAEVVGRSIMILIPPDRADEERRILEQIGQGQRIDHYETVRRRKDGSAVDVSLTVSPIVDASGTIIGASKIARDISRQKLAEEALRESEEQFRTLADNIPQLAWMADDKGARYWFNKRWYDYTGTTLPEVQGWGWKQVHHPDHVDRVVQGILKAWESGETWEDTFPLRGKDGNYRWFLSRARPIRNRAGRPVRWLGTNTDVTEQRVAEEALRHDALHDALTDLPNRAYFIAQLAEAQARMSPDGAARIAVLLLDFDGFKVVNDTLGHAAGDGLLAEIARRLRTGVRPGDVVARLGGDEFTVLLEGVTGVLDVELAARRLQDTLAAPVTLQDREIIVTASIGAALSEPDDPQPQDLLHDADVAMYQAKQQGGARFQVFDVALRDSAQKRLGMETDLRQALERGEFRVVFQPIVELETGRVRAFEALLRWQRPQGGLVTALDFIALAEQIGVILPIGSWVLREACRFARPWEDASASPVRMNVNLSARELGHPDLVEKVRTVVRDAGLAPSTLTLEFAERVLVGNVESSKAVLQRLRDVGLAAYMDDFGTISSTLNHLSLFPLHGIKINRALVHRMGARRSDLDIVRSIVDLARSLGLGVIAEGVETVVQRERLIACGCELGQGFLIAQPLESAAAASFLARPTPASRLGA